MPVNRISKATKSKAVEAKKAAVKSEGTLSKPAVKTKRGVGKTTAGLKTKQPVSALAPPSDNEDYKKDWITPRLYTPPHIIPIIDELKKVQRQRVVVMKSRNMMANRLQSIIAGTLGYYSDMPEDERKAVFKSAAQLIKDVVKGKAPHVYGNIITTTMIGIDAFQIAMDEYEKEMEKRAKELPVAKWVAKPEQRGFGLLSLATIVGEAGDLSGYSNPGKLFKRMGCAPRTFEGQTLMGSTWKSGREGSLPAAEWSAFGYSPRRRSIAYLIGENIVRGNYLGKASDTESEDEGRPAGPYRAHYLSKKERAHEVHPDWSDMRCHRHGMLLATKRMLKNLWIEWNSNEAV